MEAICLEAAIKLAKTAGASLGPAGWEADELVLLQAARKMAAELDMTVRWVYRSTPAVKKAPPVGALANISEWMCNLGPNPIPMQQILVVWGAVQRTVELLQPVLQKNGAPAEKSAKVADACSTAMRDELWESRLVNKVPTGAAGALTDDPFSVLLQGWAPAGTFAEQKFPDSPPFRLVGLKPKLAALSRVYKYHSEVNGRAAFQSVRCDDITEKDYFMYWWPAYGRWYLGPQLNSEDTLGFLTEDVSTPSLHTNSFTCYMGKDEGWVEDSSVKAEAFKIPVFE